MNIPTGTAFRPPRSMPVPIPPPRGALPRHLSHQTHQQFEPGKPDPREPLPERFRRLTARAAATWRG
jgi:hypothetical protein